VLPVPSISDLATFTGRDASTFSGYADEALAQATLLFTIVTKLDAYPADADQETLAINAILEMADRIYLEQPYATSKASPFASETIGSYSYSKLFNQAKTGMQLGLFWWDLALDELNQAGRTRVTSGSVSALERDLRLGDDGRMYVLGPNELDGPDVPYGDNLELNPRPKLG
jgi:hypothetical protein